VETILEKLARWPTRYMTIGEAAAILGHHEQTLYKAARSGRKIFFVPTMICASHSRSIVVVIRS
jgi:hypothetical protein